MGDRYGGQIPDGSGDRDGHQSNTTEMGTCKLVRFINFYAIRDDAASLHLGDSRFEVDDAMLNWTFKNVWLVSIASHHIIELHANYCIRIRLTTYTQETSALE